MAGGRALTSHADARSPREETMSTPPPGPRFPGWAARCPLMTSPTDVPSLQTFALADLQVFTKEGVYAANASHDFHLFYVGRDDVHGILQYLLSRVRVSLYLNMYGYDDDALNNECMRCVGDPGITTLITLDQSQAGGPHEKQLLDADMAKNAAAFHTHVITIGQSATQQISHTKGGVLDGRVGFEGSTNWSPSGEGTFVLKGQPGGPGYKAQNNTLTVFTDPDAVSRFTAELIAEHLAATTGAQAVAAPSPAPAPPNAKPTVPGRAVAASQTGSRAAMVARRAGARGARR
jgi:hypothetical protein